MSSSFNRLIICVISFSVYLLLKRTGKILLTAVAFVPVVLHLHYISIWFVKVVSVRILGICPVCDWTNSAVPDCTIMAFSCSNPFLCLSVFLHLHGIKSPKCSCSLLSIYQI